MHADDAESSGEDNDEDGDAPVMQDDEAIANELAVGGDSEQSLAVASGGMCRMLRDSGSLR